MARKGINKKAKGRGKQTEGGGAVSQPHSPPSSAVGREGGGKGDVSCVEEDKGDKSVVDVIPGQPTASGTSSPRSPTPPPEDLYNRKGGSQRTAQSDTQQSMVAVSFLFYMI